MSGKKAATVASLVAVLAGGCGEGTWTWTLNPDGSGKVELDARLQPQIDFLGGGKGSEDDPDEKARSVARNILAKSEGVAAWRDVSSAIAEDGRVAFKGTAYFADLGAVEITGDASPASALKPSLSQRDDGLLELGVQSDNGGEGPAGDNEQPGGEGPATEQTAAERALAVKRGKVAYQTAKPIMTAFLSTMRMEMIVRPPGEVVEASGFTKLEDGRLRLVFDGPRLLREMDEYVKNDAARLAELLSGTRGLDEAETLVRLNELVFGERGRVRAVVRAGAEPLFHYARELAEARLAHERILDEFGREEISRARDTALSSDEGTFWKISGGVVGSVRSDSGTGEGWTVVVSTGEGSSPDFDTFWQVEVSHLAYDDDPAHPELTRIVYTHMETCGTLRFGVGVGTSFGEGDIWAMGPQLFYGIGLFRRRAQVYLAASGYVWFGDRDDEFDADAEADLRLVVGLRF
jgi:hypothetical protein